MSPQQIVTTLIMHIVVGKSTDNTKTHSICFSPQYQRQEIFFSERELKKVLRDTLTRSALSGLLSTTGKLANQIARLVAGIYVAIGVQYSCATLHDDYEWCN